MPTPVNLPPLRGIDPAGPLAPWARLLPQLINRLGEARAYEKLVPVNGFAHTIPVATGLCLMTPAGALATGTLTLPAQASDGFQQELVTLQPIAALTIAANAGQTIVGATVFALAARVKVVYFFEASSSTWYEIQ